MDNSIKIINKKAKKVIGSIYYRVTRNVKIAKIIINSFHILFYDSQIFGKTWNNTFWLGTPIFKCPLDLWIYQEIIFEIKPDIIIECGTARGGGALFLASMCDLINHGKVITIDIVNEDRLPHERIMYLHGSSISEGVVEHVKKLIQGTDKVMVILDSNHRREHVINELNIYAKFVTNGSYIIVEDTSLNGHPVLPAFGPGPMEAVEDFLTKNRNFMIDKSKEKYYLTFNPKGYLRRIQ